MSTQVDIPGYVTGTWVIDTARSHVSFRAIQAGVSMVRGSFDDVEGTIVTAENARDSSVRAVIKTASVNTKNHRRDKHVRTNDFLNVEQYPTITFTSTGLRTEGDNVLVEGDLTIRGITKQVALKTEVDGFSVGPDGKPLARFTAHTEINGGDYGVIRALYAAVINKKVKATLEIEASKQD